MKTYRVIIDLTVPTNPTEWDWDNFLNLDIDENYSIISIQEAEDE